MVWAKGSFCPVLACGWNWLVRQIVESLWVTLSVVLSSFPAQLRQRLVAHPCSLWVTFSGFSTRSSTGRGKSSTSAPGSLLSVRVGAGEEA